MNEAIPLLAGVDPTAALALSIPILAVVLGIGTGMLQLYLSFRRRRELFTLYHQERMAAIEKGLELAPLPEEFFCDGGSGGRRSSPHLHLLLGLILLLGGGALMAALYLNHKENAAMYALIPVAVGAAKLLYYVAVGRAEAIRIAASEAQQDAQRADAQAAARLRPQV